jgi:arginyl-tRNA synthetase
MIKVSSDKVIVFDMDEALKFDGYTSSYLQYTIARLNSLFKKAAVAETAESVAYDLLAAPKEFGLAWKLAQYGEAVNKSGCQYDPSIIARYLFELAQAFNDYYHDTNILKAEPAVRQARLNLVKAVRQTLLNGFDLLGLVAVNEM